MSPKLTAKQRIELIERALKGEPVVKICREAGISRVLFYRWIKRYKEEGKEGLKPKPFGRPSKVKPRKKSPKPYRQLTPDQKLEMLEKAIIEGEPVAKVCKEYGISRTLFYRLKKRYEKAALEEKLEALEPKTPVVIRWARQTPEKYEQAVLSIVSKHPEYGIRRIVTDLPKVAGSPVVGHHGVQNILRRHDLSLYEQRVAWAESQVTPVTRVISTALGQVWRFFRIQPESRSRIIRTAGAFALSAFAVIVVFGLGGYAARSLAPVPGASSIGMFFASLALLMGSVFFAYSLKYYLTLAIVLSFSQQEVQGISKNGDGRWRGFIPWILGLAGGNGKNGNGKTGRTGPVGLEPNLERVNLKKYPKVSIHIPFYNEKNVVERAMAAATSFDYQGEYEVILADDSTDETPDIIKNYQKEFLAKGQRLKEIKGEGYTLTQVEVRPGVILKHLHRTSRSGFKGGALKLALKITDPKVEFISVFDADFVPYPDTLELFLKYFKVQNNMSEDYKKSNVAVVQGYQWHVLNKSENWITRGVRAEYAGSYVIERSGREIYGALKQISGAVYMIRRDVLEEIGWETSITEDFQLTLKLYEKGYKVVFTPYIQAPAECVSTIKRLIRQRMRWAEGHSNNIRKMFRRLMFNPKLTNGEKLEFLYLSPYYLQAFFFMVGTISWLLSETIFPARLPFWTSLWGWSLVLTNLLSLPLVNAVGLFLEESEERDYLGLASFVALSYILVPFQAYASLKGFLQKEEGPWFRTPKTGRITDIFTRGKFYRFISGIIPGRAPATATSVAPTGQPAYLPAHLNKYIALSTANNQFNSFSIKQRRTRWIGKAILSLLLAFTVTIYSYTKGVPEVLADPALSTTQYLRTDTTATLTNARTLGAIDTGNTVTASIVITKVGSTLGRKEYRPGGSGEYDAPLCADGNATSYGWILDTPMEDGGTIGAGAWTFYFYESDSPNSQSNGTLEVCVYRITVSGGTIQNSYKVYDSLVDDTVTWPSTDIINNAVDNPAGGYTTMSLAQVNFSASEYLYVEYSLDLTGTAKDNTTVFTGGDTAGTDPKIVVPTIQVPEKTLMFLLMSPFIPIIVLWMKKREALALVNSE